MIAVDESELDRIDRLGLAYCRLNSFGWDEIIGEKPPGFDELPNYVKGKESKYDYVHPAILGIESIIGKANTSRCWWVFELGKPEEEWLRWYVSERADFEKMIVRAQTPKKATLIAAMLLGILLAILAVTVRTIMQCS